MATDPAVLLQLAPRCFARPPAVPLPKTAPHPAPSGPMRAAFCQCPANQPILAKVEPSQRQRPAFASFWRETLGEAMPEHQRSRAMMRGSGTPQLGLSARLLRSTDQSPGAVFAAAALAPPGAGATLATRSPVPCPTRPPSIPRADHGGGSHGNQPTCARRTNQPPHRPAPRAAPIPFA